ncbi:hypothetical protein [Nitrosopumilus ureiphilus]|uniref:Uncharacterized protein n=1 Tax=Nitrosopumilus ureiphilus TaxID=1470067 RepID=A0A7D5R7W8_9ARCH|nr:hypothetical protein [Nitrosopumilus ureiphilus]QLH07458.1 hypothetical protein C5F50_10545 [Nitrosopumilus ureiphilus]
MTKHEIKSNEQEKTVDLLKEDYAKSIDEIDNLTKRVFGMCGQVSSEFLYGSLNVIQHSLELQNKMSNQYGSLLIPHIPTGIVKQNTTAWIHLIQNIDTLYVESLKNLKNNMRSINSNAVLYIQALQRGCDFFENTPTIIKNESESKITQKQSDIHEINAKNQ